MAGKRFVPTVVATLAFAGLVGACATRTAPPPSALRYPEFVYPVVPPALAAMAQAARIDPGWRFLQDGDLRNAEREFAAALRGGARLYPARAGAGYVALARENFDQALSEFDAALRTAPGYVPALVGRGQTLLALKRDSDALAAFEAALAADGSLGDVRRRIEILRFSLLQDLIEAARGAAAAGRLNEARSAYERALAASPDSAFLHRELGVVARRQGNATSALDHFKRAAELDSTDVSSLRRLGELHEERQDFVAAEEAYRRAAAIEPGAELSRRLAVVAEKAREVRLPAEFRAIGGQLRITRAHLAALIGVRLEDTIRAAPAREVVMTDLSGHWATPWIVQIARAGVMEPFANHTFQPESAVTRADLAGAVSRLVALIAVSRPQLRPRLTERPRIADMSASHLSYPAASVAVATGVMPLRDGDRFDIARPVSGAEATEAVRRLRALADSAR